MRQFTGSLPVMLFCLLSSPVSAQDIPPRLRALAKNEHFRLERILGTPEMAATHNPTSALSANGRRAVYVEDLTTVADGQPHFRSRIIWWDPEAKARPTEIELDKLSVSAIALAPEGNLLLLAGQTMPPKAKTARAFVSVIDFAKDETKNFDVGDQSILSVALAPDGRTALTGTMESVKRWDLKTGKELASYGQKNKTGATAIAYLPDGKQFLTGSQGGTVSLWDIDNTKSRQIYQVKGGPEFTWWLAPSKDGKRFIAADFQTSLTVWETTGKEINTLRFEPRPDEELFLAAALAGDGKTVLAVRGKLNPAPDDFASARLFAWDAETKKTVWSKTVPYRGRLPILVRGDRLLIGGGPNVFDVWDWKKGQLVQSTGGHKGSVNFLAALVDGDILSAGQEGMLFFWRKGVLVRKEFAHQGAVTAFALNKDRSGWLSAGADLVIRAWPGGTGKSRALPKKHTGLITSLAFSPDNKWAASASADRTIMTWDLAAGKELATFAGHADAVNAVAISPDGRWIASGSDDATVRLWPIQDGKPDPDREVIVLEKHTKPITCLAFSPGGKTLLSGSQDQRLIAWDWKKGSMDFIVAGHKNYVTSLLFVDAKTVLSASDDLCVCRWDLGTGMETGRIDFGVVGDCPRALALQGNRLLIGSASWLIYEFEMLPAKKSKTRAGSSNQ